MRLIPPALLAAASLVTAPALAQTVTVDLGQRLQTIDGFGGFGPAKVWWEGGPWHDAAYLDLIIDDLGSDLVRTQIYWDGEPTNDDADPDTFNWDGFNFSAQSDNGKQFPFLTDVAARGARVIASVWTPPIWMKQNVDDGLASFCSGQCGGNLDPQYREELAEYLAAYVLELRRQTGVELHAISIQNELIFANPFESCVYTAADYAETLKVVGARFAREGLSTRFFGPEHMGDYDWNDREGLFSEILDDSDAAQSLDVYAVHGYLNGVNADTGSADGWVQLDQRVRGAGKDLWMTETSDGGNETTWSGAWEMAKGLHLALRYGQINAWVYWYYAGALVEGGAPLPLYHLFKGWYRHVRPGFVQVGSTSDEREVLATAFERGGSLTVVLLNDGTGEHTVSLAVSGGTLPASFEVYRASEADQGFLALGSSPGTGITLPARSITTLTYLSPNDPGDPPAGQGGSTSTGGAPGSGASGGSNSSGAGGSPGAGGTGVGGSANSGGAPAGTGAVATAGAAPTTASGEDDEGCSCRSAGAAPTSALSGLLLLAGLLVGRALRRHEPVGWRSHCRAQRISTSGMGT